MNGYIGFYNGKRCEILAETLYAAKQQAVKLFNPPKSKSHMVHVHLAEINGNQVTHTATE